MLEDILNLRRRFAIARHREAPLLKEREKFLEHLHRQGTSLAALRGVSWQLLNVIAQLKLTQPRRISIGEIKEAGRAWAVQQRSNPRAPSYKESARFFTYVAKKWLRFSGMLTTPPVPRMRFAVQVGDFARWMLEERGMSPLSVRSHCWKASQFLKWFCEKHHPLSAVRLQDVDEFLTFKGTHGWNRTSVAIGAHALRVFFRYAEQRGWCRKGLGEGIESPRLYVHEGLPEGPEWKDVQRLLKGAEGGDPATIRARAILLLFAVYGLRSGEVARLQLGDVDWGAETFTVSHSKRGGAQKYPLQYEVGEAILEYLRKARPQCACRHLFITLTPPYRPVCTSSLWEMTSRRMQMVGIRCRRKGPHSLRHACATHLLESGASLKEIGDLLGHRNTSSAGIYAKVHLTALRRVADFDLGGLL